MFYRKQHIEIFKALHIKNPEQVYNAYMSNYRMNRMLEARSMLFLNPNNLYGSGKKKDDDMPPRRPYVEGTSLLMESDIIKETINCKFEGRDFTIYEAKIGDGYDISLFPANNENKPKCIHITTHPSKGKAWKDGLDFRGDAEIQTISYFKDCIGLGAMTSGGGTILLKLAKHFLKERKQRYDIKQIILMDNSLLHCTTDVIDKKSKKEKKQISRTIKLGLYHTLKNGHTWYGEYGFRPYDNRKRKLHKDLNELYENNINIVANTKISNDNLFDIIYKYLLKKSNADIADNYIETLKLTCKKLKIITIQQFFNTFYLDYKKECYLLSKIVDEICEKIGIEDFYTRSFFLKI
jgi:hypothetical protein